VIDTHCHLTFPNFRGRVAEVLDEASRHGVLGAITISTTTADCLEALALAREHPRVWCSSGVHPLHSHEGPHAWENLGAVAADPRCIAWGELGLDNHYEHPPRDLQLRILGEQLGFIETTEAATARRLPIILHCRDAFDDLIPILRRASIDPTRFVFHCFTGGPAEMRKVLDFGAMISFTGIVTYRNARQTQDAARLVPLSRLMVETDAPYLSPEPRRGTRPCEPWMSSLTARHLADLRGEEWDRFHEAINENTRRFFGIDAR
jgi:TatD DNase family protein